MTTDAENKWSSIVRRSAWAAMSAIGWLVRATGKMVDGHAKAENETESRKRNS